jgi:hypothetical protein
MASIRQTCPGQRCSNPGTKRGCLYASEIRLAGELPIVISRPRYHCESTLHTSMLIS